MGWGQEPKEEKTQASQPEEKKKKKTCVARGLHREKQQLPGNSAARILYVCEESGVGSSGS